MPLPYFACVIYFSGQLCCTELCNVCHPLDQSFDVFGGTLDCSPLQDGQISSLRKVKKSDLKVTKKNKLKKRETQVIQKKFKTGKHLLNDSSTTPLLSVMEKEGGTQDETASSQRSSKRVSFGKDSVLLFNSRSILNQSMESKRRKKIEARRMRRQKQKVCIVELRYVVSLLYLCCCCHHNSCSACQLFIAHA